jgi:hypothetical protein
LSESLDIKGFLSVQTRLILKIWLSLYTILTKTPNIIVQEDVYIGLHQSTSDYSNTGKKAMDCKYVQVLNCEAFVCFS